MKDQKDKMKELKRITKLVLKGRSGRDIVADITYPLNVNKLPVVIFCHGFKGFKDWGHFNLMADEFARAGFAFLKFNFSHNGGTVEHPLDFPDLNAFGENDFIKEIEDMSVVMDLLFNQAQILEGKDNFMALYPHLNLDKLSMMGHSRGGGMAAVFCASENRISKLILLSAVSDFAARQPDELTMKEWKDKGVVYIENTRTMQQMPMFYNFVQVFDANQSLLNIQASCKKMTQKTFVVQGLDDQVVPSVEAEHLIEWLQTPYFLFVENGDHAFGSHHPFEGLSLPGQTNQVISSSIQFLKNT